MTEQEMVNAQARLDAIEQGAWYSDDAADVRAENQVDPQDTYFIASCSSSSKRFSENATFIAHAPDDLRKALAALQRVRRSLIDDSYEMNSWSKAVSVADIITALNGKEVN